MAKTPSEAKDASQHGRDPDRAERIAWWLRANLWPRKTANRRWTTYGLKHAVEAFIGYRDSDEFTEDMIRAGFEPTQPNDGQATAHLTWPVSERSPVLRAMKDGKRGWLDVGAFGALRLEGVPAW